MENEKWKMFLSLLSFLTLQPTGLERFPLFLLIVVELAGQGLDRDIVDRAEMTPQDKAQIKLPCLL